ncbi:hypothetical protein [Arthrobacter sp. MA-N2]|uniref:hypothetical protein n=1 Tax=Arthrobacter sp. MA-N2 TaxID=1101188 RepID=UPI0004844A41|nr:hypothetical protein [Arthrobacter sp. MA-N2]
MCSITGESAPAAMQFDNNGTVDVNIAPSASTPMIEPIVGLGAGVPRYRRPHRRLRAIGSLLAARAH